MMRILNLILILFLLQFSANTNAQDIDKNTLPKYQRKGQISLQWGWNRAFYTNSDIHFWGDNYDFTLYDVPGHDKQTQLGIDPYLKLNSITIPQVNYCIGYFITEKLELSLCVDHMKYVMSNSVTVKMDGYIENTGTQYDGTYDNEDFILAYKFLSFEHTDGLNYINLGLNRFESLWENKTKEKTVLNLDWFGGVSAGILYPKTNTKLLNFERYDEFHLAGYGLALHGGFRFIFNRHFFLQLQGKSGFINMPDIRTTQSANDRAEQHFFFAQGNFTFGALIGTGKK